MDLGNVKQNYRTMIVHRQTDETTNLDGMAKFKTCLKKVRNTCIRRLSLYGIVKFVLCRFQIIETMMTYRKEYIFHDVLAGVVASLLHLSQGLAYGALAGLTPSIGLYVSFFTPIIYAIFGTSTQLSVGAFAVVSLLIGETVNRCVPADSSMNATELEIKRIHAAASLSFTSGLIMIAFFFLKFGACLVYLTEPLIGGYLCASAFYVVTSQVAAMLGIKGPEPSEIFEVVRDWIYYFKNLRHANAACVIVFLCTAIPLAIIRYLNKKFRSYLGFTIPVEFVLIILTTVTSWKLKLSEKYNVTIIGNIPKGLPKPVVPSFAAMRCMGSSFVTIALVTMAINISLALKISMRSKRISANQELFAYGMTNFIGSFFQCFPSCASISRTSVIIEYHAKSQVSALVSSFCLAMIIFFLAPYLKHLPMTVLAAFVIVNILPSLTRVVELWQYYKTNLTEAFVWFESCACVLIFGIDTGLLVALLLSVISNIVLIQRPVFKTLGRIPNTNVYGDTKIFPEAITTPGIIIFTMEESLCCYNSKLFKRKILRTLNLFIGHKRPGINKIMSLVFRDTPKSTIDLKDNDYSASSTANTKFLIVDCTAFVHIDSVGIRTLLDINNILTANGTVMLLCGLRDQILKSLQKADFFQKFKEDQIFILLEDAVKYATEGVNTQT